MPFPKPMTAVPSLTTEQMIEVDRAMIEDFHIELVQMMENAGRCLAVLARDRFLDGDARARRVAVLAGTGGNGGGAMVCARRLHGWGAHVDVFLTKDGDAFTGVPGHQLDILRRMHIGLHDADAVEHAAEPDVIVDGMVGYSLEGAPRGEVAELIAWANAHPAPTLALDVPSGLDATTGTPFDPAIVAVATCTLAMPKGGLRKPEGRRLVGELYLADISVPPELYAAPPLDIDAATPFSRSDIVRLD